MKVIQYPTSVFIVLSHEEASKLRVELSCGQVKMPMKEALWLGLMDLKERPETQKALPALD